MAMSPDLSSNPAAPALVPIALSDRVFGFHHHLALWFSLGTGLLVIQIGAYLVPAVGTRDAALAIVLGSVIGAGLLAWTARLGCRTGLSSAGLMQATYGSAFARLPVLLNIVQLIGWTTFELVVMRDGTSAMLRHVFGWDLSGLWGVLATTVLWGAVLTALMTASMLGLVRRFVGRYGLPLVAASLIWLAWQFWQRLPDGAQAFWDRPGNGSMGLFSAVDLVIAMPVSWLPLVADYARYGKSGGSTMRGTWLGYALANTACYGLGVLVASTVAPGTDLVAALLLAQGGLLALGLILLDEMDNAYGDAHSAAVSAQSLQPRFSLRRWAVLMALVCTALAVVLPMRSLEPFMLMLSSVFVPLYGVILGRWALRANRAQASDVQLQPALPTRAVDWSAAAIWLSGIACFHGLAQWAPGWGSALPTLALTFALAWATAPARAAAAPVGT